MVDPGEEDTPVDGVVYRWECPLCAASNVGFVGHTDPHCSAIGALRSHIRVTGGDGHGPKNGVPPCVTTETLREHVAILTVR